MKRIFLIFLIGFALQSNAQNKEALFAQTTKNIIIYLAKWQIDKLNRYVQSDVGVYSIYRMGVRDLIELAKQVDNEPFPQTRRASIMNENIQHPDNDLLKQIQSKIFTQKNITITFNCETEEWLKEGIFTNVNINKTDRLSRIINIWGKYEAKYKAFSKQKGVKKIEINARKITITKYDLVLYLYYDNKKWWLGIIDDTEADCSA